MQENASSRGDYDLMCSIIGEQNTRAVYKTFAGSTLYFPVYKNKTSKKEIQRMISDGGNVTAIARRLGMSRSNVYRVLSEDD